MLLLLEVFDAFMKEGVAAFREKRAPNYESSQ